MVLVVEVVVITFLLRKQNRPRLTLPLQKSRTQLVPLILLQRPGAVDVDESGFGPELDFEIDLKTGLLAKIISLDFSRTGFESCGDAFVRDYICNILLLWSPDEKESNKEKKKKSPRKCNANIL